MKVLVTGGLGYVGRRLVPYLETKGHFTKVFDLAMYSDKSQLRSWDIHGDIRYPVHVKNAMRGMDAVIHLAAISNDPTGNIDEVLTRQVNFDAVGLLIREAKAAGVTRFINASSSSVFGIKKEDNVTELLEPEPLTHYSKYKALSEWIVSSASSSNFCTVNIRPATICGWSPRLRLDLTVNKMTIDAITKGVITVQGGQQRRPNIGMLDVITLYEKLLTAPFSTINGETYNFGFENLRVIDIAKLIQSELSFKGVNALIKIEPTTDNRDYHICSDKIVNSLGYKPVSSIAQEIAELQAPLDYERDIYYNMKSMKLSRHGGAYWK